LTATVAPGTGGGTPAGTVSFLDGTTLLGTAPVDASGRASVTTTFPGVGQHAVVARASGDGTFAGSISPAVAVNVGAAQTTTTLTASMTNVVAGQSLILSATVAAKPPAATAVDGVVVFSD